MEDEKELEMLLKEIPHATSEADVSCGNAIPHCTNKVWLDSSDSLVRKRANQNLNDELLFCRNLGNMNVENANESYANYRHFLNGFHSHPVQNLDRIRALNGFETGYTNCKGVQSPLSADSFDYKKNPQTCGLDNLCGSRSNALLSQFNCLYSPKCSSRQRQKAEEPMSNFYRRGHEESNLASSFHGLSMDDASFCAQKDDQTSLSLSGYSHLTHNPRAYANTENSSCYGWIPSNRRHREPSNLRGRERGDERFFGDDMNFVVSKSLSRQTRQTKGALVEIEENSYIKKLQLEAQTKVADICDNVSSPWISCPFLLFPSFNSLADAEGKLYIMAKDQHGCRFLQKIFDEGTPQDVQIVFDEIIHHVVELMLNPFGNYLIQKLLDVCNEKQKLQILLVVTNEPGELVTISLNSHGTRVVQKLVETLNTRQQIRLVTSALEPGFLALIIDPNGNHVIQRCLQCLSIQDTKFIFVAAARYCVEISTHQHGCCVLQRCIRHSNGVDQEKLVDKISSNGLFLAQDAYGNYVVQFILELTIPSAIAKLMSQFRGNYVHLSMQKFSSHVVEKCLVVSNNENRSKIINELISAHHFDQLLQHPHANYVIQTALRLSEGAIQNSLMETIESHRAIARNSPYTKKIFSWKLLKN